LIDQPEIEVNMTTKRGHAKKNAKKRAQHKKLLTRLASIEPPPSPIRKEPRAKQKLHGLSDRDNQKGTKRAPT
jgi:hypothetical protein